MKVMGVGLKLTLGVGGGAGAGEAEAEERRRGRRELLKVEGGQRVEGDKQERLVYYRCKGGKEGNCSLISSDSDSDEEL